jgi:hypothetical protein
MTMLVNDKAYSRELLRSHCDNRYDRNRDCIAAANVGPVPPI